MLLRRWAALLLLLVPFSHRTDRWYQDRADPEKACDTGQHEAFLVAWCRVGGERRAMNLGERCGRAPEHDHGSPELRWATIMCGYGRWVGDISLVR